VGDKPNLLAEQAREAAETINGLTRASDVDRVMQDARIIGHYLVAAYRAGERRMRERAAEVATAGAEGAPPMEYALAALIARAIRNLPDEEPGT
jgi:hypothetical protein